MAWFLQLFLVNFIELIKVFVTRMENFEKLLEKKNLYLNFSLLVILATRQKSINHCYDESTMNIISMGISTDGDVANILIFTKSKQLHRLKPHHFCQSSNSCNHSQIRAKRFMTSAPARFCNPKVSFQTVYRWGKIINSNSANFQLYKVSIMNSAIRNKIPSKNFLQKKKLKKIYIPLQTKRRESFVEKKNFRF